MLSFFYGTDRQRARGALEQAAANAAGKKRRIVRITDAHSLADLQAALGGRSLFGEAPVVVLDGILANDALRAALFEALPSLAQHGDVFLYEERPDAQAKRTLEKSAARTQKFAAPAAKGGTSIFRLADALAAGDKKALWVGYQRALASGERPEAVHGVLFWGAKREALAEAQGTKGARARSILARLAQLPHEARRRGEELEYALEAFLLGINK